MNHYQSFGLICLLLLISLSVCSFADEAPKTLVYVQGGEGSIMNTSDGSYVITMKDIIPYVHLTKGEKSSLLPVNRLQNAIFPLNAALVFSGKDPESYNLVTVHNLSISDKDKTLSLQITPLDFYEGETLNSFAEKNDSVGLGISGNSSYTGVYLEFTELIPENSAPGPACIEKCLEEKKGRDYEYCETQCKKK